VPDLVASGRTVPEVAFHLEISDQTISSWLRQDRADRGLESGLTTPERAELRAARRRIAESEAERAIHRRAVRCWAWWRPQRRFEGIAVMAGGVYPWRQPLVSWTSPTPVPRLA
jgi:transposase-like protein